MLQPIKGICDLFIHTYMYTILATDYSYYIKYSRGLIPRQREMVMYSRLGTGSMTGTTTDRPNERTTSASNLFITRQLILNSSIATGITGARCTRSVSIFATTTSTLRREEEHGLAIHDLWQTIKMTARGICDNFGRTAL